MREPKNVDRIRVLVPKDAGERARFWRELAPGRYVYEGADAVDVEVTIHPAGTTPADVRP